MARAVKKRVQVLMSKEMGDQVEALAARLGVSESAAGAVLIAAGLTRFADVLQDPTVLQAAVAQVRAEMERQYQGRSTRKSKGKGGKNESEVGGGST